MLNSQSNIANRKRRVFPIALAFLTVLILVLLPLYKYSNWSEWSGVVTASASVVTAVAVLISAAGAFRAYDSNRLATVDRTTFEVIHRSVHDKDLMEMFDIFRKIRIRYSKSNGKDIEQNYVITHDELFESYDQYQNAIGSSRVAENAHLHDYDIILRVLNYYESVAIGIRDGAINELMMRNWWRTTTVRDFIDMYVFIHQYRIFRGAPKVFEEAELLAVKWADTEELADLEHQKQKAAELDDASPQPLYKKLTIH